MWLIVCAAAALGGLRKLQQNDKKFTYFLYAAVNILTTEFCVPSFWFILEEVKENFETGSWLASASIWGNARKRCLTPWCPSERSFGFLLPWLGMAFGFLPTPWSCLHPALTPPWLLLYRNGFMTLFLTPLKLLTRKTALAPLNEVQNKQV